MTPQYLLRPARLAGSPLLATQSDDRLVDLVRAGSEPAFDAIVTRYRGELLRYCGAIVGRERAEDALQQTFLNAFNSMRGDDNDLKLKPWLYRIAHNVSLNGLRDRALQYEPLDPELAGVERPHQTLEQRDQLAAVLAAVESLPSRQRDAIVLRELEGRSYDEIADALGVGGGSVRALLNRARNSVRLAATAITPVGLLLRIPAVGAGASDAVTARVVELTAGAGAGAIATKVAATALVTGAVAGGVALGPGSGSGDPGGRQQAPADRQPAVSDAAPTTSGSGSGDDALGQSADDSGDRGEDDDRSGPSERSGPGGDGEDRSGPGDGDDGEDHSGPGGGDDGEDHSGPGRGEDSEDRSGPGGGDSEDRSGPGGGGGDTLEVEDGGSGSGSSGSGSSGSGSSGSGSGSSGSGSSGSDSDSSGSGSG